MQKPTDIAILWKQPDGWSCVLRRRGTTLLLTLLLFGSVQIEQAVESPREAIELAQQWQQAPPKGLS